MWDSVWAAKERQQCALLVFQILMQLDSGTQFWQQNEGKAVVKYQALNNSALSEVLQTGVRTGEIYILEITYVFGQIQKTSSFFVWFWGKAF